MSRPSSFVPTPDQDVLDIKPLRTLSPMFPAPLGLNTFNQPSSPGTPPLVFVTTAGQFPGLRSFSAFGAQDAAGRRPASCNGQTTGYGGQPAGSGGQAAGFGGQPAGNGGQATGFGGQFAGNGGHAAGFGGQSAGDGGRTAANGASNAGASADMPIDAIPISAYKSTPPASAFGCRSADNGGHTAADGTSNASGSADAPIFATPLAAYKPKTPNVIQLDDDDDDDDYAVNQTSASGRAIKRPSRLSGYRTSGGLGSDSNSGVKNKRHKSSNRMAGTDHEFTLEPHSSSDPREVVEEVLMTFEALRRRHLQLDEAQETGKRADLKASAIMNAKNLRANAGRRIGVVPGVEIGDIFYFRMELSIIGLHAPSMAGIDYMTATFGDRDDDSVAICIVAAGVYENDDDATDTLVYSGSGGNNRNNEDMHDQKLERGNLALERSLSRKNVIRVVRGYKDPGCLAGKVYMYDGLYKIHESWKERTRAGINCFKYKLVREPGQPEGFAIWKMSRKWVANPDTRDNVLHPDLSSGAEYLPVCLVNDVNSEKGPGLFTYISEVKYLKPLSSLKPLQGCRCVSACLPTDSTCGCAQCNGGNLPYSSTGLLVCRKPMIYECGESCLCSVNCRNRVTQKGAKIHFEVFRTENRGWGLRSWDPIRAGSFICEYVGEVIDDEKFSLDDSEDDYLFQTVCPGRKTLKWNYGPELIGEQSTNVSPDTFEPLPIKISAKKMGNISRFMNHSCAPNAFWQPVQFDHGDDGHPHIMFFALKHIPPMTELTYDYGEIGADSSGIGSPRAKSCLCGSSNCRGYFC
ncbi:histone-lysine N-methyltransferase, H3 lysine-9 specific SUVH1-like [Lolium rigidum]|uniref:histone-lysine N-methyltransferase, H3 lysine-9 specific SUVH1-like n=1 Tax=Lolium rigidum TaxID=89674 RepID=UPI001F5E0CAA|nr:histone-lysine N-methyltransferase, H3 lysine-9 specific SUVH1-like [Lolium rigidum]